MFHYQKFSKVLDEADQKFIKRDYWRMAGMSLIFGAIYALASDAAYKYGRSVSSTLAHTMVVNVDAEPACEEALRDIMNQIDG